ncbi:MAG: DUF2391 family protein [Puniceicoccales bacterium]
MTILGTQIDLRFNAEDVSQVIIGAFALAVPIAFTEEAWRLGEELPWPNLLLLVALSLGFLCIFSYHSTFSGRIDRRFVAFGLRVIIAYCIALLVVALVLLTLNRLPLLTEPIIAMNRVLVTGMPASMGAIMVDGIDKESWSE